MILIVMVLVLLSLGTLFTLWQMQRTFMQLTLTLVNVIISRSPKEFAKIEATAKGRSVPEPQRRPPLEGM